ncbi:MAG: 30S ribosomal protein S2 [bacterium]|nr:30S ribosomal protein S2 [bacterium]
MQIPSLLELLQAGVHFGHKTSKSHPKMSPFIFGVKNGVHIINLEETQKYLVKALDFLRDQASKGKKILFIGTKSQAQEIIKKYALECGMPYAAGRWLGGTITNFSVVSLLIQKMKKLRTQRDSGELEKYTKKEQLDFTREIERLEKSVGGLQDLVALPDVVFIWDIRTEETVLREALKKKIPIVAVCDTNVNPKDIDYIIPANDDAVKSVELLVSLVAAAINEGKAQKSTPGVEEKKKS